MLLASACAYDPSVTVEETQDLYALPLDTFVSERGKLAKQLRAAGKRDQADEVAALPKPSLAAWTVNQLVRTDGELVRKLTAAGDAVIRAQTQVLAGKADTAALSEATERERELLDELRHAAAGLLEQHGRVATAATIERVADTFHAAALDVEVRDEVISGTLTQERQHVGFGSAGGLAALGAAERPRTKPERDRSKRARRDPDHSGRRELEASLANARRAKAQAERAASKAQHELEAAQARRQRAAAALAEADAALAEAGEALDAARKQAARAEAEHDRARRALAGS